MVRTLALRSGVPGFTTRYGHSLNLFLVIPGLTSRPHLLITNWFASGQLGFFTVFVVVVVVFFCFVDCISLALKSTYGEWSINYVLYCIVLYCIV